MNKNCNNCYFGNNCHCSNEICENYVSLFDEEMLLDRIELERVEYRRDWFTYINEDTNFFDLSC